MNTARRFQFSLAYILASLGIAHAVAWVIAGHWLAGIGALVVSSALASAVASVFTE